MEYKEVKVSSVNIDEKNNKRDKSKKSKRIRLPVGMEKIEQEWDIYRNMFGQIES